MAQNDSNIHRYDFLIGIIIMLAVIFLAFVLAGNDPKPVYPDGTPNTCDTAGC